MDVVTSLSRRRMSSDLLIYNSLTRKKEPFVPLESGKVRMYTCGLTVNYLMHIGHARTYIFWDVVERFLEYLGYDVRHVSNITDISVDDNILKRVRASGEAFQQLTTQHTQDYYQDRYTLGIRNPYTYAIATQHIQEMIELVQQLLDLGFAYEAEDGVYFRISKFPQYGQLAGLDPASLKVGASGRVDKDQYNKEHAGDFALWKRAKPGEPFWYSPWGPGRPGWHIECSAMSMKYLGTTLDISGGGEDNLFPHHENSIAQSQAATGKPYVRYWMHVRHLNVGRAKMSKSTGNFLTVREAVEAHGAATLRLFLLATHYRKPITFDQKEVERKAQKLDRLRQLLTRLRSLTMTPSNITEDKSKEARVVSKSRERFIAALLDDFNTGRAVNHFFGLVNQVYGQLETDPDFNIETAHALLNFFGEAGRILLGDLYIREILPKADPIIKSLVELLLSERARLRNQKHYQEADAIRVKLQEVGFKVTDTKDRTLWWKKSVNQKEKSRDAH